MQRELLDIVRISMALSCLFPTLACIPPRGLTLGPELPARPMDESPSRRNWGNSGHNPSGSDWNQLPTPNGHDFESSNNLARTTPITFGRSIHAEIESGEGALGASTLVLVSKSHHVGFSSLTKYDGSGFRRLAPAEVAQIAGRAGRFMEDGTFGPTARGSFLQS